MFSTLRPSRARVHTVSEEGFLKRITVSFVALIEFRSCPIVHVPTLTTIAE